MMMIITMMIRLDIVVEIVKNYFKNIRKIGNLIFIRDIYDMSLQHEISFCYWACNGRR
jgi:uncharacterized membrane protein